MDIVKLFLLSTLVGGLFLLSCEEEVPLPEELTVQARLDDGETPFEIYQSDNSLIDSLYGKIYKGGLVFYLNSSTGAGMVSSPSDQGKVLWGCESTLIGGTLTDLGSGATNTQRIIALCNEPKIAARICDELVIDNYSDWYLPSKEELNLMHKNLRQNGFGNFILHRYWSSSEYDAQFAHCQLFNANTNQLYYDKDLLAYYVRAVRSF